MTMIDIPPIDSGEFTLRNLKDDAAVVGSYIRQVKLLVEVLDEAATDMEHPDAPAILQVLDGMLRSVEELERSAAGLRGWL